MSRQIPKTLLGAGALACALGCGSANAQEPPNAEACVAKTWGYLKVQRYEFGAVNTCAYPVSIWFRSRQHDTKRMTVGAGESFGTGLTIAIFEKERSSTGWIVAVCPDGSSPSLTLSDANWDSILNGKYSCNRSK